MIRLIILVCLLVAVTQAQTYRVLYSFKGGTLDGCGPEAGLTHDRAGNLYGTTFGGGASSCFGGCGTVFRLSPTGVETVLHMFQGSLNGAMDGALPQSRVLLDQLGNIYGTTIQGGNCGFEGCGTVFKVSSDGTETVLHSFAGGTDGAEPTGGLVTDSNGHLYGTSSSAGSSGGGTVFRITTDGSHYAVVHSFVPSTEGLGPEGDLVWDKSGNLYGVNQGGGLYGMGTVFKLEPQGALTVLHNFSGGTDGESPRVGLIHDNTGNLYGVTRNGGDGQGHDCFDVGCGIVFKIDATGIETVLYPFQGGSDGADPTTRLTLDSNGNLYGATDEAGFTGSNQCTIVGCGVVFRVTPVGEEKVLHSFGTFSGDGYAPFADGMLISDRILYGTTTSGGAFGCGTVFAIAPW